MHNNGKQLNKGNSKGKLMKYITTSNLYWDGFVLDNLKEMPFENNEIDYIFRSIPVHFPAAY